MLPHPPTAKGLFVLGVIVFILGSLMMCHCPWIIFVAAVLFGGSWLFAAPGRLRFITLVFFAIAVFGTVYEDTAKRLFEENARKRIQELHKSQPEKEHGSQPEPERLD